jgi:serine/threonine protein kinase
MLHLAHPMRHKSGSKLGGYEILAPLGAGGMGEVYRARDSKLQRDVAIKVLPEHFAQDPDRLSRFHREAQVLASLNHANIGVIYDLQEDGQTRFLVLELVEGESLAERLQSGPLAVDDALSVCKQVAEALEAAHAKSILHRDLKPANIQITKSGNAKVLDFGLAKLIEPQPPPSSASNSPTLSPLNTVGGVILGTASYMSPEQARAREVDKRTDIWAFGCVLFEALTGGQVFKGESITDILAAVCKDEPDWTLLPVDTPDSVRWLLRQCLRNSLKVDFTISPTPVSPSNPLGTHPRSGQLRAARSMPRRRGDVFFCPSQSSFSEC